ncbi:hypothetical protein QTL97_15605 [Sporosarcina thermotolerans]|uniref:DUF5067 domain-containing protein n=1 Tax=Sporosarcina thermotolerans TaxID=633404 RepID=A0AAW9AAZ8_9BACL|nr:hypothetical protein [Sporosarcina thermotolerans]MDW0118357.1 hypothetical protein [Sporosarcina thermotolerans]WHT49411.1 hypothetical protein QNH10_07690 [Sporosarcina thermotolerans]
MKKLTLVTSIILFGLLVVFLGFIYISNPIVMNGSYSTYEDMSGEKDIVIHFYNEGISRVLLKEVLINKRVNSKVELGVSYDTLQIVQSGTDNNLIVFGELDKEYVDPKITSEEILGIINKKEMTPIHYGIRIKDYEEPIESITIKYKYLGFPVTKEIKLNIGQ